MEEGGHQVGELIHSQNFLVPIEISIINMEVEQFLEEKINLTLEEFPSLVSLENSQFSCHSLSPLEQCFMILL